MKSKLKKLKKPVCGVVMLICLFLLLGCTGTAERGGDLGTYVIQGVTLLGIATAAGFWGGLIE